MKHVIVEGLDISYNVLGSKKPILMIHGWGSNSSTYIDLAKKLSDDYMTILVDLPGFGSSQAPREVWNLHKYGEFLELFLSKIGVKKLYGLVGHSLGGRIAIYSQSHGILKSGRLILIASHGIASPRSPRIMFFKTISKLGKLAGKALPPSRRESLRRKLYQKAGSTDYLNINPSMKGTFKNIINQDLRNDAKKITTKTLLIYGSIDDMTPVRYGEIFSKAIPDSRLEVVQNAGHYVHTDAHDKVLKLMKGFLI